MSQSTQPDTVVDEQERAAAIHRIKTRRDFGWHVATYVILNGFLTFIWSLHGGSFWPIWVLVPWGVALAFHAASTFLGRPVTEPDIRREMSRRDRQPWHQELDRVTDAGAATDVEMTRHDHGIESQDTTGSVRHQVGR